jgi:hypothetical protein
MQCSLLKPVDFSGKYIVSVFSFAAVRFILVSCLAYSSTLKMKAALSSETLGDIQLKN